MATPKKMGRKGKFCKKIADLLIAAARDGLPHKDACAEVGISTVTLYDWLNEGDSFKGGEKHDFALKFREAEGHCTRVAVRTVTREIATNFRAAAWYLERQQGWNRAVTMTGPNGGPIRHAGPDGQGPIPVAVSGTVRMALDLTQLTEAQLDALESIARQTLEARHKDGQDAAAEAESEG